jgi:predicted enzyme related to lactoylglutathione lyase
MPVKDGGGASVELLANIDVDDIELATRFYCEALGLHIGRRFGAGAIELLGASSAIYLLQKAAGTCSSEFSTQVRDYSRHWTPVHLDFVVSDIEQALSQARAAGARVESGIRTHDWGRIALLADPCSNGFCLIQFLARGYDEIAT